MQIGKEIGSFGGMSQLKLSVYFKKLPAQQNVNSSPFISNQEVYCSKA